MTETTGTAPAAESGTKGAVEAVVAAPAEDAGELASLKSRNSGLNSKVGELQTQINTLTGELGTARKGLTDKDSADVDLRKQIGDLQEKLDAQVRANEVSTLKGTYPEAARELGEGIFGIKPEVLASLEARLTQAKDGGTEPETPRPVGNNQQRTGGPKNIEDMTSAELQEAIKKLPREAFGLPSR